jgi:hypothetical protein
VSYSNTDRLLEVAENEDGKGTNVPFILLNTPLLAPFSSKLVFVQVFLWE